MLRKRYEQMREQVLERAAGGVANHSAMLRGMRSWMEDGSPQNSTVISAPVAMPWQPEWEFPQMVAVLASVLVWQAERS